MRAKGLYLRILAAKIAAAIPLFCATQVTPGGARMAEPSTGMAMTGDSVEPATTCTRLWSLAAPAITMTTSADWTAARQTSSSVYLV